MSQFPWGFTGLRPNASENLPDHGAFDARRARRSRETAHSRRRAEHDYAALVGSDRDAGLPARPAPAPRPVPRAAGRHACRTATSRRRSVCDDGPFGHGTGGQLRYSVKRAGARRAGRCGSRVAGSDNGPARRAREFAKRAAQPRRARSPPRWRARDALERHTQLTLPGDPLLQRSIDWGKQNLADLTQDAPRT